MANSIIEKMAEAMFDMEKVDEPQHAHDLCRYGLRAALEEAEKLSPYHADVRPLLWEATMEK